jgi:predicted nucleic acid-binding protein
LILADTSIWIAHFRGTTQELAALLNNGEVLCHPHIVGELACGNLRHRGTTLQLLRDLPTAAIATDEEVLACIQENRLFGTGLGYTDVNLLASALLTPARLWTVDRTLAREARRLGISHEHG